MTPQSIAKLRVLAQHIAQADFKTPEEAIRHLVALQAQDYPGALLSIAQRINATQQQVETAIRDRKIVRTWPMRGTLHMLAAEDVRWVTKLLAPRAIAAAAGRRRQLELDDSTLTSAKTIIVSELQGQKQRTRTDLCAALDAAGISTAGQRGIHILHYLSEQGLLCFGPHQGKQPTFVLLDEWLLPTPDLPREEALKEIARRYFIGHGPATLKDFAGWTGLTLTDARLGLDMAKEHLAKIEVAGTDYWLDPTLKEAPTGVHLLPGFDEFILGYKDRSAMLKPEFSNAIVPGGNGMFLPTLVIEGQVQGTWKRIVRTKSQEVIITPFTDIPKRYHSQIDQQITRLAHYYGISVSWRFTA